MGMIPYGRQDISVADIQAVVDVLNSDYITQGPVVPAFEKTVSEYCGAEHAVAVSNATSALHIACLALGVCQGDLVWTTPITFVASANCALYCGADIDFVDIDPKSYNMSVEKLSDKLDQAEKNGRLPKVIIPVHLSGQSCEMETIYALSLQYGFKIIEDASHAIGGRYNDEPIGNCRYSDITVFSFHPVKIITTGEGGMLLTNDSKLAKRLALLRSHGITRDVSEMTHASDGSWFYQQVALGYNYRMTDIQAALGLSQMQRLDEFVKKRNLLAKRYDELLKDSLFTTPWVHPDGYSSFHLYVVKLILSQSRSTHREVFENLRNNGVGVNLHYIPVYHHPYYERFGFKRSDFPEAESYYSTAISIPMYPGLTEDQQAEVVRLLVSHPGYQTIF